MTLASRLKSRTRIVVAIFALSVSLPIKGVAEDANDTFTPLAVQKIIEGIQTLRGLKFKNKVALKYLTANQIARQVAADAGREPDKTTIQRENQIAAMVGLYPAGTDVTSTAIAMARNQIAGLYDFRKKDLIIVERSQLGGSTIAPKEKLLAQSDVLAHELTHALQ